MKCKDCKHCKYIANTEETRQGICSAVLSYFPVIVDKECVFKPKRYRCDDCDRLYNDTACFTCRPEDSAYHNNKLCSGFIDKKEVDIMNALTDWKMRGYNIEQKLEKLLKEFSESKIPSFEPKDSEDK